MNILFVYKLYKIICFVLVDFCILQFFIVILTSNENNLIINITNWSMWLYTSI